MKKVFKIKKVIIISVVILIIFILTNLIDIVLVSIFNTKPIISRHKETTEIVTIYESLFYDINYCYFSKDYKIIVKGKVNQCPHIQDMFIDNLYTNSVGTVITYKAYLTLISEKFSQKEIDSISKEEIRNYDQLEIMPYESETEVPIVISIIDPKQEKKCFFGETEDGDNILAEYKNGYCIYTEEVCKDILKVSSNNDIDINNIYKNNCGS